MTDSSLFTLVRDILSLLTGTKYNSNKLSFILRKKIEAIPITQWLGIQLAGLTFFTGIILPQATDIASSIELTNNIPIVTIDVIPNSTTARWPLSRFGISQWFSAYHPGLDLTADFGSPVYSLAEGIVAWTNSFPFGYGNHILIEHQNNVQSLYAHLSTIYVQAGDHVSMNSIIGEVGSTGWSTGNHLHVEVYENNTPINPIEILPILPSATQSSAK